MMTYYYQFAGVDVAISMPEDIFFEEEYRLKAFRKEQLKEPYTFRIQKTDRLLPPQGQLMHHQPAARIYMASDRMIRYIGPCEETWETATIRAEYRGKDIEVQMKQSYFPDRITAKHVLDCLSAEHLIARNNGFILHCSCIERNGKAILFTAPSETGKSTQAELWNKCRNAGIINGDRAAVRLMEGVLLAEGIPFAGSSRYCENRSLPIEAIVYLAQASKTSIRRLHGYEAFFKIWEGVSVNTWDKVDLELVSYVVQKAASEIPVFYMPCTPDESAVIALEEKLSI